MNGDDAPPNLFRVDSPSSAEFDDEHSQHPSSRTSSATPMDHPLPAARHDSEHSKSTLSATEVVKKEDHSDEPESGSQLLAGEPASIESANCGGIVRNSEHTSGTGEDPHLLPTESENPRRLTEYTPTQFDWEVSSPRGRHASQGGLDEPTYDHASDRSLSNPGNTGSDQPPFVAKAQMSAKRKKYKHRQLSVSSTTTIHSVISDGEDPLLAGLQINTLMHDDYAPKTSAYNHACGGRMSTGEQVDFVLVAELPAPVHCSEDLVRLTRGILPNNCAFTEKKSSQTLIEHAQWRMSFEGRLRTKHKLKLERCVSANGLYVYTLVHVPRSVLKHSAHHAKWPMRLSRNRTLRVLETLFPHQHLVAHAHRLRTWGTHRPSFKLNARGVSSIWSVENNTSAIPADSISPPSEETETQVLPESLGLTGQVMRASMVLILKWFPLAKETHLGPYLPAHEQKPFPWTRNNERPEERCFWPYDLRYQNTFEISNTPDDPAHFSSSTRSLFVHDILSRTKFLHKTRLNALFHEHEIGIDWLIHHGAFKAAFPLHDGPACKQSAQSEVTCQSSLWQTLCCRSSEQKASKRVSDRRPGRRTELGNTWARFSLKTRPQPLDEINEYFGSRVAMYFVFLSHYTTALIWPATFGLVVFIYGLAFFRYRADDPPSRQPIVEQVCNSTLSICGPCSSCNTYELGTMCTAYEATYIIDNIITPIFAFLMALWSSAFLDFWERTRTMYVSYWNLNDTTFRRTEHRRRPEFKGCATRLNLLTGKPEEYMPDSHRRMRYLVSGIVMIFFLLLVYGTTVLYIVVRRNVTEAIVSNVSNSESYALLVGVTVGASANLVAVVILNYVFTYAASRMTHFENHETKYQHSWYLTAKKHVFSLISTNALCLNIVFVKVFVTATPHDSDSINEPCAPYGCQLELAVQLLINMVCKQVVQDLAETYMPKFYSWYSAQWQRIKSNRKLKEDGETQELLASKTAAKHGQNVKFRLPWEEDFEDDAPESDCGLFADFDKLAIQFSFCTFFVTALPIAPLLAFINNMYMLRIDAYKLTTTYRRTIPHYDTGISIWFRIFECLSFLGVLSTGFVMAFSSQVIPRYVHESYRHGDFSSYVEEHFALYKPGNCSFPSTLDDDGHHTKLSLTILCVRLVFLIFFENAVYLAKIALYASIPSVPTNVRLREELAQYVSEAVIAEVTGVTSEPSDSEISDSGEREQVDTVWDDEDFNMEGLSQDMTSLSGGELRHVKNDKSPISRTPSATTRHRAQNTNDSCIIRESRV